MLTKKTKFHYGYVIVAICCLSIIADSLLGAAVATNYAILRADRGFTGTQIAMVSVIVNIAGLLIGMPLFSKISYRLKPRMTIFLSLVVQAFTMLLWALCKSSVIVLYISAALLGFSQVYCGFVMIHTMLVNNWFNKNRGLLMGFVCAGTGFGSLIWAPIIQALYTSLGGVTVFVIQAAFILLIAFIDLIFVKNTAQEMGLQPYGGDELTPEKESVLKPSSKKRSNLSGFYLAMLVFAQVLIGFAAGPSSSNLSLNFRTVGFDPVRIAAAISVYGLVNIVCKMALGRFKDTKGMFVTTILFGGINVVGCLLCFMARFSQATWLMYAAIILYGIGMPIQMLSAPNWAEDFADHEHYISCYSKLQAGYMAGQLAGSYAAGAIADATGNYTLIYLCFAIAVAAAVIITTWLYLRKRRLEADGMKAVKV